MKELGDTNGQGRSNPWHDFVARALAPSLILVALGVSAFALPRHVTYIDEMLVLCQGRWNCAEGPPMNWSFWSFISSIALDARTSYGPLQFILTWLLIHRDPVTPSALVLARIPSFIAAMGAMAFMFRSWVRSDTRALGLLPLLCGVFAPMLFVASVQDHTYAFGAFGALCFCILTPYLMHVTPRIRCVAALLVALLCWGSYQLIILSPAPFLCAAWIVRSQRVQLSGRFLRSLLPGLIALSLTAVYVCLWKMQLIVSWWTAEFLIDPSRSWPSIGWQVLDAYWVAVREVLLVPNAFVLYLMIAFCFIGLVTAALRAMRGTIDSESLTAATIIILFPFVNIGLVIIGKPSFLAPSRHSLIVLGPLILTALLGCNALLASFRQCIGPLQISALAAVVVNVAPALIARAVQNAFLSQENFDPELIARTARSEGTNRIVVSYYDAMKVRLLLEPYKSRLQIQSVESSAEFPRERFLLIGQFPRIYGDVYSKTPPGMSQRAVVQIVSQYDFEPSNLLRVWPNELYIWVVEPIAAR